MGDHARALAANSQAIRVATFYGDPESSDRHGEHYQEPGLISAEWLAAHTPMADATYFLCGPKPFLRALVNGLARKGVPADRVKYEFFGPADDLLDEPALAA
jgi:nitric oxide dioxygenase